MLLARVRLTPPFRQARKSLNLPIWLQSQIRHTIRLDPLAASRIYATRSVTSRHSNAGLYEHPHEFRNDWGLPELATSRYLYVDHNMPVWVYDLQAGWSHPSTDISAVSSEYAAVAEQVAQLMAEAYGDSV